MRLTVRMKRLKKPSPKAGMSTCHHSRFYYFLRLVSAINKPMMPRRNVGTQIREDDAGDHRHQLAGRVEPGDAGQVCQERTDVAKLVLERHHHEGADDRARQRAQAAHQRHQDHRAGHRHRTSVSVPKPSTSALIEPASPDSAAEIPKANGQKRSTS